MPDSGPSAPRTLICGSLALDTIMVFPDRFARHILPGETHVLSVSFQIREMRREWGGCAGNIAYNLKGLGGEPVVMATVGDDGVGYVERLAAQDVAADGVRVIPGTYTAQAFIITDLDDNQITAFHPGAMNESHRNRVGDVADIALGIVAPDGREGMRSHVREFAAAHVPFIFDPGQGLPLFSGAELIEMVDCAEYVAVNDYEARLLAERTGVSIEAIAARVDALIVMSLFRRARGLARKYALPGTPGATILFVDELDSIGMSRGGVQGGGQQQGMMGGMMGMGRMGLNTMLNQMDSLGQHVEDRWRHKLGRWLGFIRGPVPPKPVVFVIGATNRPDVLDPALVRPGRLDRKLQVYEPDGDGRRDIIQHYLKAKAHDPEIDLGLMVTDSIGWTPVEIKTIINEALIVAHDQGRDFITYKDWLNARDVRMLGLKQPIASLSAKDKRTIAYHEAGHAVAARYLGKEDRINKASIIRMGDALGVVQWSPREERYQLHAQEMEERIMISLGSRAVEENILGTKTANASHDLQSATSIAMAYVGQFGMGPTLLAVPMGPLGGPSPQVLRLADALLDSLYDDTKRLMREKEYAVHAVAQALIQRGELIGPELDDIFVYADEANPEKSAPFLRRPVELPKLFEEEPSMNGSLSATKTAELI